MIETSTPVELAEFVAKRLKNAKIKQDKPSQEILEDMFNVLFYTSLQTEEGQFIKVTVTLYDHEYEAEQAEDDKSHDDWKYYPFKDPIPFTEKSLTKLSKAADPWSSSLAVYYDEEGALFITGMIDQAIHFQSFLNFERSEKPTQPGILQVMVNGVGMLNVIFDYEPLASLNKSVLTKKYTDALNNGPINVFLKEGTATMKRWINDFIRRDFKEFRPDEWNSAIDELYIQTISRILLKIQNYRHGGTLLITDDYSTDVKPKYELSYNRLEMAIRHLLRASILHNSVSDDLEKLENDNKRYVSMDDYQDYSESITEMDEAENELKGAVRFVASLSCVDGLILLSNRLIVKSFGTVITRKTLPDKVFVSETGVARLGLKPIDPSHFGTRHQSMFAYCYQHSNSVGFVVSQDGEIRAVKCIDGQVIIWENIKVHQFLRSKKLLRPFAIR